MLLLEVRSSTSKGSINRGGSYQSDLVAIEGEVKDTAKFPGNGWAFFSFGKSSSGKMLARTGRYTCLLEHLAQRYASPASVAHGAVGQLRAKNPR